MQLGRETGSSRGQRTLLGAVRVRAASALIAMVSAGCLVSPGLAAAAGPPVTIGPGSSDWRTPPSVAVDAAGTAYVAWADPTHASVDYCVLPAGASSCSPAGTLQPTSSSVFLPGQVRVVIVGGQVAVLATAADNSQQSTDQPTVEWQAADGTANFAAVDGGSSIAASNNPFTSPYSGFTSMMSAIAMPGASGIGTSFITADGPPTFAAAPVTNPPTCSFAVSQTQCPFATLENPLVTPDPFSNLFAGNLASMSGPAPAVLGVQEYWPGRNPAPCATSSFGAAFFYGTGLQSATNNYNVSAGQPNSAWKVTTTPVPGSCGYAGGAVTGGASGLGLLEDANDPGNPQVEALLYKPFDQVTHTFDKPAVTVSANSDWGGFVENYLTISQDQTGGLFAVMYANEPGVVDPSVGVQNVLFMFHSSDGGQTWQGPAPLDPTLVGNDTSNLPVTTSDVGAGGIGWVVRRSSSTIQAMQFSAADAANQASVMIATPPVSTASTVLVGMRCYAVPCQVSATLLSAPTASRASTSRARRSPTTLGSASAVLSKHGVHDVVFHLTRAGKRLLAMHQGKLRARLAEATTLLSFRVTRTLGVNITRRRSG